VYVRTQVADFAYNLSESHSIILATILVEHAGLHHEIDELQRLFRPV